MFLSGDRVARLQPVHERPHNMVLSNGSQPWGSNQSLCILHFVLHCIFVFYKSYVDDVNHALFIDSIRVVELSSTMLVCSQIKVLMKNTHNQQQIKSFCEKQNKKKKIITQY